VHVDEAILAEVRARFGEPALLEFEAEISKRERDLMLWSGSRRRHDVTLFILNGDRLALIRKPHFEAGIWRTPGGGIKPGEDFVEGARREALEETGLAVELDRYLVLAQARFHHGGETTDWRTHVLSARTADDEIGPRDLDEIAEARWGTTEELLGPVREDLLATARAFWRYRVALHDAAVAALGTADSRPPPDQPFRTRTAVP
jgi:8-oxo-dGTP pyrophosphatase MutT (NUDIX family)